ncbi:LysR family transcriptional regulator [Pseudomonas proteolytica]|uniref:LysR family transcriptional regulator n=1 Tax=Pseudomonas proteolytica TaxID=219574 RepID=A0AAW5AD40_9PSED|nr:LysR family transcriptional regulator [Pseudomonas proteolytica]KAA8705134.1 LysR family transcriptional regulator [Pseudomonas proteolytica]MCF5060360.1 LysR family transcriptional regulator [Pseudomonas proteolytica]MCF5103000.1 LysR family transcriptional regulator [Pseudomonas proteolytica]TWR85931.1 LysR family transcriptional regulator [Pseudomonas proteolytica]SED28294.1 DNA-binding transcriptional regulator, LysR family [Pseudomonas proteolytica]
MDLFQAMTVYVKVVEAGSMTAAAQACGLSTTMVGNHLRALEQRLGVSLLKRTTRKQSLTEFGGLYYQRCLEVLGLVANSEQLAEQIHSKAPQGLLRITAPPAFGAERLAPALSEFSRRYPKIQLYVVLSNQAMDLIDSGFDVAIRLGELQPSSLIARPLQDYTMTLCASPHYLARRGTPQQPMDLQAHDCLAFAYPSTDDWRNADKLWRLRGAEGEVEVAVSGPMTINSSQALHRAAVEGMGIVMLPDALVGADLLAGRLVALLPSYQPPSRSMHLLYAQDRYRLPKLRAFVDFVIEQWAR